MEYFTKFEGFSAKPYWDVKRWSWGYGTRVPGSTDSRSVVPDGTITRAEAAVQAISHAQSDYNTLKGLITVPLSSVQWAALISFSYNLGVGNAKKLVTDINAQDWSNLHDRWISFINAGGSISAQLRERREYEIGKFLSEVTT